MILLQSMDKFNQLAKLDTATGRITWLSRSADSKAAPRQIHGHIAQLHGRTLCLYREGETLHFRIDSEDLALTANTYVQLERLPNDVNRIAVFRDENLLFSWAYRRPVIFPPLEIDPTPFIEEEDFDFCLFVYNVVKDTGRRNRIYRDTFL